MARQHASGMGRPRHSCAEYGAAAMFAFAQKHDGASLNSALSAVMLGYHLPRRPRAPSWRQFTRQPGVRHDGR